MCSTRRPTDRADSVQRPPPSTSNKKARRVPGFSRIFIEAIRLLGHFFGNDRTVDQLDIRHRRIVAGTEASLQDAQVAAGTGRVTRAQFDEQLAHGFLVAQASKCQTTIGNAIDLADGDQRLGDATQFLGLRQGGLDQLVLEQRGGHIAEHGFAVCAGTVELTAGFLVTHEYGFLRNIETASVTLSPSWRC
ncbi:conserved hypothetical protein [Xanthomonas citri pv. citri]|nr:conserved hypothetical protein [Xanthomonas citri pv. citri]